jgi:muconolactone delta-isomerase
LTSPDILMLHKFDRKDKKEANYVNRFITKENLDDIWDSKGKILRFTVFATDSTSNLSKIFIQ